MPFFRFILCLVVGLPLSAQADYRFELGAANGDESVVYAIRDGKVRMQPDASGKQYMLYNAEEQALYMIDGERERWTRMDRATVDSVSGAMNDAMKEMEKQLAQMPAEQREAMKRFMPDFAKQSSKPEVRAVPSGDHESVAGIRCEVVTVYAGDILRSRLCIAEPSALDISGADYDTLRAMFSTMQDFASQMPASPRGMTDFSGIDGIPISSGDPGDSSHMILKDHSDASLDAELFDIPASYAEQKIEIPKR